MGGGQGKTEVTAQQRANLEIGTQQMQDWRARWLPQLTNFAKKIDNASAPDSYERRHATSLATADTSARFAAAGDQALGAAAASHTLGSSKQKLGIVGMGNDLATSAGHLSTQADQAVDDSTIAGLKAVTSLARGEKAYTINALGRSAAISGEQARADAEQSLAQSSGYAGLAGKIVGTGAGLYMGGNRPVFGSSGLNIDPDGLGINNTGTNLPTAGGR